MRIRRAVEVDLEEMLAIYNYEVLHGVATLDLHPRTMAEWKQWFSQHNRDNHPLLVAEENGHVAGYASLSPYREKEAFRTTVELSVYVAADFRRHGVALMLLEAILTLAREDADTHTVISVITSGNEASRRLHERFGFTYCGTMTEVGMKFGRYQNIDNYQKHV